MSTLQISKVKGDKTHRPRVVSNLNPSPPESPILPQCTPTAEVRWYLAESLSRR